MSREWKLYQVLDEVETRINVPLEEINDEIGTVIDCVNDLLSKNFQSKVSINYHRKFKEPSTDETLIFKLSKECEEVDE